MERLTEKQSAAYDLVGMQGRYCEEYCRLQDMLTCRDCVIYKAIQKLAEYENAEEQGLLLKLPCKIGDTVFVVGSKCLADKESEDWCVNSDCDECKYDKEMVVFEMKVQLWLLEHLIMKSSENWMLNKTVFITKEEAEQALAKMKEV